MRTISLLSSTLTHTLPPHRRGQTPERPPRRWWWSPHSSRIDHGDLAAAVVLNTNSRRGSRVIDQGIWFLPVLLISPVDFSVLGSKTVTIPDFPLVMNPLPIPGHDADAVHRRPGLRSCRPSRLRSRRAPRPRYRARRTAAWPNRPGRGSRNRRPPVSESSATRDNDFGRLALCFLTLRRDRIAGRSGRGKHDCKNRRRPTS